MILKLILTALTILLLAANAHSLSCVCTDCPEETCETAPNSESTCYKSVTRITLENGTYATDTTYGCLSGSDGMLSHLQCSTVPSTKHVQPLFIRCCKDRDYCNDYLPDPSVKDDPRWKIEPPQPKSKDSLLISEYWQFWILIALIVLCLISLLSLRALRMAPDETEKIDPSRASTCFLDADLERFNHAPPSSSVSTHSYSISDDMCHKPDLCHKSDLFHKPDLCHKPVPSNATDDSFALGDLTSGVGERMLEQRTMARAVGSGKTDQVGSGRFGTVFRGEFHGEDVAVKAFRTIDQESWRQEEKVFSIPLNHQNIVRFIASDLHSNQDSEEIWMFLEYCPYGSLCDYLDHNEVMGQQQAVKILYSIINGLNYLHEDFRGSRIYKPPIAHRDIKSKNILMKTPDICCIADFGHALIKLDENTLDYGKYQHSLQVGTIRYMAPEILKQNTNLNYRQFSTFAQADVYQFGLILWEVCNRTALDILHPAGNHKLPYDGVVPQNPDLQDMVKIVCEDQYRPERYDKWFKYPMMKRISELMVDCWRPNPKARMETLGVKKKLMAMYAQIEPSHTQQYQLDLFSNYSLSPNFRSDSNRTMS